MLLLIWWLGMASTSTPHQHCAKSINGCRSLNEYSFRLHSLHSTVSYAPVLHTSSTPAYWSQIFPAMAVSALWNVVTGCAKELCRQSFHVAAPVIWNICTRPASPKTVSAWLENQLLPANFESVASNSVSNWTGASDLCNAADIQISTNLEHNDCSCMVNYTEKIIVGCHGNFTLTDLDCGQEDETIKISVFMSISRNNKGTQFPDNAVTSSSYVCTFSICMYINTFNIVIVSAGQWWACETASWSLSND